MCARPIWLRLDGVFALNDPTARRIGVLRFNKKSEQVAVANHAGRGLHSSIFRLDLSTMWGVSSTFRLDLSTMWGSELVISVTRLS